MQVPSEPNIIPNELRDIVAAARPGPNFITHNIKPHSSLNLEAWKYYAPIYTESDPTLLQQLIWGFPTGVPDEAILSVPFTNHTSARRHPDIVEQYINKHISTKALYGPFSVNPLDISIIVSPLQVAFSRSGKPRVVNDLSYGDHSVNESISSDWSQYPGYQGDLTLPTSDILVDAILRVGKDALLWKTDFAAYYKQLNIDLAYLHQLAFAFDNKIYFESRLPFGLRTSCLNAQRVSQAAIKIYNSKSPSFATAYVDDCIGCSPSVRAQKDFDLFWEVTEELGMQKTLEKCQSPSSCVVWTGLQYDTIHMEISLPNEKKDRIIELLEEWLTKNHSSKSALQSLLGTLNHACSVIIVGRAFSGHIMDLIRADQFPIHLDQNFKSDVRFWLSFLRDTTVCKSSFKSPHTLSCDSVLQVAVHRNTFAVRIHDDIGYFKCEYDENCDPCITYIFALWMASMMLADIANKQWITIIVPTVKVLHNINRARAVTPDLRPMVRQTWWVQATRDFVIRAKLGQCDRLIDRMLRQNVDFTELTKNTVPDYFKFM